MMDATSPEAPSQIAEDEPLDPDRTTPQSERPATDPAPAAGGGSTPGGESAPGGAPSGTSTGSAGGAGTEPPGLIAQLKATKDAVLGVVRSHIALGKAEAEVIKGEIAYAAAFVGIAIAVLLLLGIFLPIALMLFTGEWLFGSIGWGLLLGTEMLLAIAVTAVVAALRLEGPVPAVAIAVIAGFVTFIVLGASWPYMAWQRIGESLNLTVDAPLRTWLVAVAVVGVLGALVGLIGGARAMGPGGGIAGLIGGLILGGLIGAFLAYDFGWRVGAALGLAILFATYIGVLAARVTAAGADFETIKLRFWPQQTIDTTRETIEWAKTRNPLAPKS